MEPPSIKDEQAIDWARELQEHHAWMLRVAASRTESSHEAHDVVQEVAIAVIQHENRPNQAAKIRSWLYQLVVRRSFDLLRAKYRRARLVEGLVQEGLSETSNDGWDWLLAAEQRERLMTELENLTDQDREMFTLKYCENWSYSRLAEHFGIGERVVEYRLILAKRKLRVALQSLRITESEP